MFKKLNQRHKTHKVNVGNVSIGGDSPVVIQSMTNTDTADVESTVDQIIELADAGSEVVRITVNNNKSAEAVPKIKELLYKKGYDTPISGCFHYNGHQLMNYYPEMCQALDKYRINPGNVGFGNKRDKNFETIVSFALKYNKPIRIGVNWGSLDQYILQDLMDKNANSPHQKSSAEILEEALIISCLSSAARAEELGLPANKIILSCKTSKVNDLISIYQKLAEKSNYALHLGLTEAGMGIKGYVSTASALAILLNQGIGDTIRASITPKPGESRTTEVKICQEILQSIGIRSYTPQISSCPGCGRTTSTYFQELAQDIQNFIDSNMPSWKLNYPGVENLNIAVMGCIVNGPGESKHADIGISLPGTGESPVAPVFIDGEKAFTLRGSDITDQFKNILLDYIEKRFHKISQN